MSKNMRRILVAKISNKTKLPQSLIEKIINPVFDCLKEIIEEEGKVTIQNFGTFQKKHKEERLFLHPLSGKKMTIAPKDTIKFKPSELFFNTDKKE